MIKNLIQSKLWIIFLSMTLSIYGTEDIFPGFNFKGITSDIGIIKSQLKGKPKKPLLITILDRHDNVFKSRNAAKILDQLYKDNPCKGDTKKCIDNGFLFTEGDYAFIDTSYPDMNEETFNNVLEYNFSTLQHTGIEYFTIKENRKRERKIRLFGVDKEYDQKKVNDYLESYEQAKQKFSENESNIKALEVYLGEKCKNSFLCVQKENQFIDKSITYFALGISFDGYENGCEIIHKIFTKNALHKLKKEMKPLIENYMFKGRDKGIFDTLSLFAKSEDIKVLIVFIGKAHEDGLKKLSKKNDYSFISIDPKEESNGYYPADEIRISLGKVRPNKHPLVKFLDENNFLPPSKQAKRPFSFKKGSNGKSRLSLNKFSPKEQEEQNRKNDFAFKESTYELWNMYKNDKWDIANEQTMKSRFNSNTQKQYIITNVDYEKENGRLYIEIKKGNKTITRVISSPYNRIEPKGIQPINEDRVKLQNEKLVISDYNGSFTKKIKEEQIEWDKEKHAQFKNNVIKDYTKSIIERTNNDDNPQDGEVQFIIKPIEDDKGNISEIKTDVVVGKNISNEQFFFAVDKFNRLIYPRMFELGQDTENQKISIDGQNFNFRKVTEDKKEKFIITPGAEGISPPQNFSDKIVDQVRYGGFGGHFFKKNKETELAKK